MNPSDGKSEPTTLDFIDALRGFAIMGVIAVHTTELVSPHTPVLLNLAHTGGRGVQLFFVVSALTLFLSLATKARRETSPYRNFFVRRFFRIAPLFSCAILIYPLVRGTAPYYFAPDGVKWWHFLMTVTYTNGWIPESINSVVPGGWSIAVEMSFYLFVPLLFVLLTDLPKSLVFLGICLFVRIAANALASTAWSHYYIADQAHIVGDFTYLWFFNQLPVFAIGIITYHLFARLHRQRSAILGLFLLAVGLSLFLVISLLGAASYLLPTHVLQSFTFGCVAIGLALHPTIVLVNRLTCWVGKLSYSLYLTHFAILGAMGRSIRYFSGSFLRRESDLFFIVAFVLIITVAALVSTMTYKVIESPGIALGRRIIKYLDSSPARFVLAVSEYQLGHTNNDD